MLRIYVIGRVGSIGQQNGRIEFLVDTLRARGFNVTSALDRGVYEKKDWKTDHAGARKQLEEVKHFFAAHEFDIVIADLSTASDGRNNEQEIAEDYKIPVFGFVPSAIIVSTPFRIARIEEGNLFTEVDDLVRALENFEAKRKAPQTAE